MRSGYWKKEIELSDGSVKVIVYYASAEKTMMYRDGKIFDMTDKLPLSVFGMEADYDVISEEEAKRLIEGQMK